MIEDVGKNMDFTGMNTVKKFPIRFFRTSLKKTFCIIHPFTRARVRARARKKRDLAIAFFEQS